MSRALVLILALTSFGLALENKKSNPTGSAVKLPGSQPSKPQSSSSISNFRLLQLVPVPTGWQQTVVVENYVFCPTAMPNQQKKSCLLPDEHVDRTGFTFTYASTKNYSTIKQPVVWTKNASILQPKVLKFETNHAQGTGSFVVVYGCKSGGEVFVSLKMELDKNASVSFTWKKACGSGKNELVKLVPIGLTDSANQQAKGMKESGPTESKTIVELRASYPQMSIDFSAPRVTSDNKDIVVDLRGHVQSGTVTLDPQKFTVVYTCKSGTSGKIAVTVAIPPWSNETVEWFKDCGGSKPFKLAITRDDVVVFNSKGIDSAFKVTDKTTVASAQNSGILKLGADTSSILFHIDNLGDVELSLDGVALTVSNPKVLAVMTEGNRGLFSEEHLREDGKIALAAAARTKLKLQCICMSKGTSVVLVTIPVTHYETIEFGFLKICERPHVYRHSGFLRTAPSLLLALLACVGVAASVVYRIRRNETAKYSRVATGS